MRQINQTGLKLIEAFEGCYLEAYPDPASKLGRTCRAAKVSLYYGHYKAIPGWETIDGTPWTIGFGATRHDNGSPIQPGETITAEAALPKLVRDVQGEGSHFVDAWVTRQISDDQYAALTSFCFNAGAGTFHRSAILTLVNAGHFKEAADAFLPYDTAQGVELAGLARRRRAERALFLGDYATMTREINS